MENLSQNFNNLGTIAVLYHGQFFKNKIQSPITSPEQIRYCGIFEWAEVEQQTRQSIIKEKAFYFQNDRQGFLFSNSLRARQQFPELKTIKPKDQICFQFSPQHKDEQGRYILTAFTLLDLK